MIPAFMYAQALVGVGIPRNGMRVLFLNICISIYASWCR